MIAIMTIPILRRGERWLHGQEQWAPPAEITVSNGRKGLPAEDAVEDAETDHTNEIQQNGSDDAEVAAGWSEMETGK